jgi:16S rRNA G966 N2-methylase RsmD
MTAQNVMSVPTDKSMPPVMITKVQPIASTPFTAVACSNGLDPASRVNTLRVLAVHADLPYAHPGESVALDALATGGLLGGNTIVVAEHEKKFDPGETAGILHRYRTLQQGDAALSFYRQSGQT